MYPTLRSHSKWLMFMLSFCLLLGSATTCFAKDITLSHNGHILKPPVAPIMKNDTTLVPLRVIIDNLGATVDFKSTVEPITITQGDTTLILKLNDQTALINNEATTLTQAPLLVDGTTMVPLRFISQNFNCEVNWISETQTVALTSPPIATLVIKDYGTITLELYPEMAPLTVSNFCELANSGFYDGLIFHRIISGFMIQGGDPLGNGTGGPGHHIPGEFLNNGFEQNILSHVKGIISMARSNHPNSGGSQFFITSADATFLDGQYAAFGKVISGMTVIDKVQSVATDSTDKPITNIVIESIRVKP